MTRTTPMRGGFATAGLVLSLLLGCGSEPPSATNTTGNLTVTVATTGVDLDADGYTVTVAGTNKPVGSAASASVDFPGLVTGAQTVELSGVASNCTVDQNPKSVTIVADQTAQANFTVTCVALVGSIEVSVTTTGPDQDSDGYTVTLDGTENQAVATSGSVTFTGVALGDHSVDLTGIAANCTVDQTPKTAAVTFGNTTAVAYTVTCIALVGNLDVTVATTGPDADADGYTVTVDGTQNLAVPSNGTVSFTGLTVGAHSVSLTGIAANCSVGQTPQTATVTSNATATLSFSVTCVAAVGNLDVIVATTGPDPDADGYTITVDGAQNQTVTANGTVNFPGLTVGDHSVALTGLAVNCSVDQTPRTAPVAFGATATVTFTVTCVAAVGNLDVTVTTTGPNPDPDGYTVTVDGTQSQSSQSNGTVNFAGLVVGDRSVALSGVAANCTVDQNPKTASVAFGSTATLNFVVTCVDLVGNLDVTVTTTGSDPDPEYTVTVDGTQSSTVTSNGTANFVGLAVGDHVVDLTGLAANCTVDQTPKTGTVVFASTATVSFSVTCVPALGDLYVTVASSGADIDPDGYTVTVDGTLSQPIASTGFVNFVGVAVGDRQVSLTDVAPNCTVDQTPKTATVAFGVTTVLDFVVTCATAVGNLDVTVATTGVDLDPDGYTVTVDGTEIQVVGTNGTVTFTGLLVGDRSVDLTGLEPNCTVDLTPKTATVVFGTTTTLTFDVVCVTAVGDLDVTVTTTGPDQDPDGYTVTVDGTEVQVIPSNGTVTFTGLVSGPHSVALTGLALNCTADLTPKPVTVVTATTTTLNFTVTCVDLLGNLDVTVNTTGTNPDPDGYTVSVDGAPSQSVSSNGTVTFLGLSDGNHTVTLTGVANNCTPDQNPQIVSIVPYSSVTATFNVACTTAVGNLDVSVTTTGTDLDPDGYTATVDAAQSLPAPINGTTTFIGLAAGNHSVSLTGVAGNCTVAQNPKPVVVLDGQSVTLNFIVTCYPILVGAGDIALCNATTDDATANLLDGILGTVYTLGDNAYESGTAQEYIDCYDPTWGRHKARTRPSAGNRDYLPLGASGYFGYFGAAAGDPAEGYYSYDLGSWHIVVLNSNLDRSPGSPQMTWLANDLAASSATCTLAYWHHSLYSSSGNDNTVRPFWDALYAAGADVVLGANKRNYERFAPQNPGGGSDPSAGIRQFVVGTGGADLTAFQATRPNSEAGDDSTHGVLKLYLKNGSYSWEFVPIVGRTFTDSGSANCH